MAESRTGAHVIIYMILLLVLVSMVLLGTEIFQVDKITVMGSKTVDNNVIIGLSGIVQGDNIFKISKNTVRTRIEESPPYLVVSSVSIQMPNEVILTVEEREPSAAIPYLSSYIVIDAQGFILDIVKQQTDMELPVIEGIRMRSLTMGKTLVAAEADEYRERILYRILENFPSIEMKPLISVINIENPDDIRLTTRQGYTVLLGQATALQKKLSWLSSEGYESIIQAGVPGTLEISGDGQQMVFRPEQPLDEVED